jgi:hypothetical protein
MNAPTVLRAPCAASGYRSAVATIIRDIERAGATLLDIAENIDASRDTVSDAKYEKTTLNAVHLARLGQAYGASFLNPYFALFGAEAAPIKPVAETNLAPLVAKVNLKLVEASDPDGPGGVTHVPQERAAYLPDLKAMSREAALAIREIEGALA